MRIAILVLLLPSALQAQSSSLLTPAGGSALGVELLHPFFQDDYDRNLTSGGAIISGRVAGPGVSFLVDVPLYRGPSGGLIEEYASGIGNPYLGVEFSKRSSAASFELGTRVPLNREAQASSYLWAALSDLDRSEAFGPKLLSVWGIAHVRSSPTSSAIQTSARVGFVHRRYSDSNISTSNQLAYALTFTGRPVRMMLDLGVSGRLALSALDAGFDAATLHQLGASMRTRIGGLLTGAQLRVPLDQGIPNEFSVGLTVEM